MTPSLSSALRALFAVCSSLVVAPACSSGTTSNGTAGSGGATTAGAHSGSAGAPAGTSSGGTSSDGGSSSPVSGASSVSGGGATGGNAIGGNASGGSAPADDGGQAGATEGTDPECAGKPCGTQCGHGEFLQVCKMGKCGFDFQCR